MEVLITGGTGYVGGQCSISLLENGYDIVLYDNFSTGRHRVVDVLKNLGYDGKVRGVVDSDIKNVDELNSVFENYEVDAVMHFAALSLVVESMADPALYYCNNVSGTIGLLEAMRAHHKDKIVFSSTAAVYGEPVYTPLDENHPLNPINPYGRSKLMVERIMDDYDKAYGLRSVRLRYFNVAGADSKNRLGEWHDPETHLIPNVLRSTMNSHKPFSLFGNDHDTRDGTCIRDYVNIEDLAEAHVLALRYLTDGGKTDFFNLGTKRGSTVKEVYESCKRITGTEIQMEIKGRRAGDPTSLVANSSKAERILGWVPKRSLDDSICTAYEWEKKKHSLIGEYRTDFSFHDSISSVRFTLYGFFSLALATNPDV